MQRQPSDHDKTDLCRFRFFAHRWNFRRCYRWGIRIFQIHVRGFVSLVLSVIVLLEIKEESVRFNRTTAIENLYSVFRTCVRVFGIVHFLYITFIYVLIYLVLYTFYILYLYMYLNIWYCRLFICYIYICT